MRQLEWHGLYKANWTAAPLVPEAYSHPAKVAFGLAAKIYQHMLEQGYIKPGDHIVDPFGGIAGFAFHAMRYGLHWHAMELEPRFVDLGQQNIELWNGRYREWFADWGTAVLVQGDSRNLTAMLGEAGGVVSSPPYIDAVNTKGNGIDLSKAKNENDRRDRSRDHSNVAIDMKYGRYPGQLGSMPAGSFDSALSSPPYANTIESGEGPGARHDYVFHSADNATKNSSAAEYGRTPGQLGGMDGSLSSPPYQTGGHHQHQMDAWNANGRGQRGHSGGYADESPGQLQGGDETFWAAARVIIDQLFQVLKPGAYAAFVTGNFRRNGEIVDFGGQWLTLCEACGFVGIEHITAWKVERHGTQLDVFGNEHSKDISRVSFFRRLDNAKNPGQEIESEDVWIVRKPVNRL